MIDKIKIIIFSRFKKPNKESWVTDRRAICAKCEFNTKNIEKVSNKDRLIKFFSDAFSSITGNKKIDNLGNCIACAVCSVYYKTAESVEQCPAKPIKWERITNE